MWSLLRVLGAFFFVLIPSFLSLLIKFCLHDVIMLNNVIYTFAKKLIMLTLEAIEGRVNQLKSCTNKKKIVTSYSSSQNEDKI